MVAVNRMFAGRRLKCPVGNFGDLMRRYCFIAVLIMSAATAHAQNVRDAGSIARDLATAAPGVAKPMAEVAAPSTPQVVRSSTVADGLTIGAVRVEGVPAIAREAFAPAIADYLGKTTSKQDLQSLARAIASVARDRGYVFATAVVPPQTIHAGTITVRVDEGDIAAVRVKGSQSARLQRTLNLIVGRGVRREVLERQLLLAGDVPGIEIVSTRLVHEDIGNVLVVDVRESRGNGFAGVDTYGARDLGPVRARLRYDFIGLADEDDVLSVNSVVTPDAPRELAYLSMRYTANVGTGGAQVAVNGALGRAEPSNSGVVSRSTYVSVSVSTPLQRANGTSVWANAELGALRVDGKVNGRPDQHDSMYVATGWLYATTRTGNGRLSGALGLTHGIGLEGTTALGDIRASRLDASGVFTKGFFWADWVQPMGHGFSVKFTANGQLADRPLLAAQEIGIGGPAFGRAFDIFERFGDSGFMGAAEVTWRRKNLASWLSWIEPFAYVDAGRVWNLDGGFGGGYLSSAGGGVRAGLGKLQVAVEVGLPVNTSRAATNDKSPRVNVSVGRRF